MSYEDRDPYGMYKTPTDTSNDVSMTPTLRHGDGDGPGPNLMGAYTLIGNDVYNADDEDLGDIKEIMLDMRSGHIGYAVLDFGGFLGIGNKLFAVPWKALTLDTENKRFVLNVSKAKLENAPGFDQAHWPNMADPVWAKDVHTYYGTSHSAE